MSIAHSAVVSSLTCHSLASSPLPSQYTLFDLGIDLQPLREAQEDYMRAAQSVNTRIAYASSWRIWRAWCESAGHECFPALPESVLLFVAWCLNQKRYRLETVRTHLSALRSYHVSRRTASPVDDSVKHLMRNAARRIRERPAGKVALTPEQLRLIASALFDDDSVLAVRNRAIVLLGFASAMRRSELASLRVEDLRFCDAGLSLRLGATKTDQVGAGRSVAVMPGRRAVTDPLAAVEAWLKVRGRAPGFVFTRLGRHGRLSTDGLSGSAVNEVLKSALRRIGEDADAYGAHSLRAGFVTAAAEAGASEIAIMQRTGHRSISMVLRYVRPVQAFRSDPLAGVL